MRIAILSKYASCLDLAMKLQEEDNDVTMYTLTGEDSDIGLGIIPIKRTLKGLNADLIINDDVFLGDTSDKLRNAGKAVLGGSSVTDRLENDRDFGLSIMKACGITIPPSTKFMSFELAREFVEKNEHKRYVFKPYGQLDKFITYVSKDCIDMLAMLKYYESIWSPDNVEFELQEFVPGIEMAIGGWFNGTKFCKPVLPNFEYKKLMNDDIGPNTGEMGTVMTYRTHNKLYQKTLAKAEAFLKTTGYRGFIDIACIVNEDDAYGLEWTARFGFPTIQIQDEVHQKGTWTDFLYKLAKGLTDIVPADTSKWDMGVAICALPWPQKDTKGQFKNIPIGIPEDTSHIHFDCMKKNEEQYCQAGQMGYIAICTGSDVTLKKAQDKAYRVVETINVPGGFYRTDIGNRVIEELPTLKSWGWIK